MNHPLPWCFSVLFALFALVVSGLYGWRAFEIFGVPKPGLDKCWQRWHQYWSNFVGSIAGWIALYALCLKAYQILWLAQPAHLGLTHAVLFFIAFTGITGHLPISLWGTISVMYQLFMKVFNIGKPTAEVAANDHRTQV